MYKKWSLTDFPCVNHIYKIQVGKKKEAHNFDDDRYNGTTTAVAEVANKEE